MSRIAPLPAPRDSAEYRAALREGEQTGIPDERMIEVLGRGDIGTGWIRIWQRVVSEGLLSHRLKELVRIRMSVLDQCGYCSSIRSKPAMADGLTEDIVMEMVDLDAAPSLTEQEIISHAKQALTGYKVPKHVYFRNELPKTNVGKIMRRALRDELIKQS